MDEIISQLEMEYRLDPNLETGVKLYKAYLVGGLELERILEMISPEIIEKLMLEERIPLDDEFLEDRGAYENISDAAENLIKKMANEQAAQAWSTTDDEDLWIEATFGYAEAVNGDLLKDGDGELIRLTPEEYQKVSTPPRNFTRIRGGGDLPCQEEHVWIERIYEYIAEDMNISESITEKIVNETFQTFGIHGMEYPVSVSGESTYYREDPFFELYSAKNIKQLKKLLELIPVEEFLGATTIYGNHVPWQVDFDWRRIPTWGPETPQVDKLFSNNTSDYEGLLSYDTRNSKRPKYLMFKLPTGWKRKDTVEAYFLK